MAAKPSEKVGRGFCPFKNCNEPVTYRRSSGGKLTFKCDGCDRSGYAEQGGSGHTHCLSTIPAALTPVAEAVRELVTTPAPSAIPAAPAPTKRNSFSLSDL